MSATSGASEPPLQTPALDDPPGVHPQPGAEPAFAFLPDTLFAMAEAHREAFRQARPFAHAVLDDFLPGAAADRLLREFPAPDTFRAEITPEEPRRRGKLRSRGADFTPFTTQLLEQFKSPLFLGFLERLSGIERLIPDHDIGTALRHFGRGGRLGVHADSNVDPGMRLHRRLNLILYLNRDWRPEYRGDFELWDAGLRRCEKAIAPLFNRALVFANGAASFHGFPKPLRCPAGITRKSAQFYYYTEEPPPEGYSQAHGTLFQWRPADLFNPERWLHWLRSWRFRG